MLFPLPQILDIPITPCSSIFRIDETDCSSDKQLQPAVSHRRSITKLPQLSIETELTKPDLNFDETILHKKQFLRRPRSQPPASDGQQKRQGKMFFTTHNVFHFYTKYNIYMVY